MLANQTFSSWFLACQTLHTWLLLWQCLNDRTPEQTHSPIYHFFQVLNATQATFSRAQQSRAGSLIAIWCFATWGKCCLCHLKFGTSDNSCLCTDCALRHIPEQEVVCSYTTPGIVSQAPTVPPSFPDMCLSICQHLRKCSGLLLQCRRGRVQCNVHLHTSPFWVCAPGAAWT